MELQRKLLETIENNLHKQKVGFLLGARRVGKTQLLQTIRERHNDTTLWLNGEDILTEKLLEERSVANYKSLLGGKTLLIIDEAQYIADIGRKVKLMVDHIQPLHVLLTGSSAFDLVQQGEPLVGRSINYPMYPLAQLEYSAIENAVQKKENLAEKLIYGCYPELLHIYNATEKQAYLNELVQTYLLKDILTFERLRNPEKIRQLLQLIAYQIGGEVSYDELGQRLGISKNTVEHYLDVLSKVFVLYKRTGFSRNLRKEITKSSRWYFVDNGIRNAVINNFSPVSLRNDIGALWKNYFLSERIKYNSYSSINVHSYFWRTYDQQEIDCIEDRDGKLTGLECKWGVKTHRTPAAFVKAYPNATVHIVHPNNYLSFIE